MMKSVPSVAPATMTEPSPSGASPTAEPPSPISNATAAPISGPVLLWQSRASLETECPCGWSTRLYVSPEPLTICPACGDLLG